VEDALLVHFSSRSGGQAKSHHTQNRSGVEGKKGFDKGTVFL
jgi:hypothetical protein